MLLRGTIDAGDYKQFIFPLLFYKRLCDVFDEETLTALRDSGGDQDFALFPENHRFQIPPDAHWREIRKASREVGRELQRAMRAIETANPQKLYGIFGDAQWSNKDRLSDAMLLSCIAHLRNQKKEWRNVKLYGQERNLMTSSIARMNCFLHGIEDFRIERGDTLGEPKLVEGDRIMRFDVVLANPPTSSASWRLTGRTKTNPDSPDGCRLRRSGRRRGI